MFDTHKNESMNNLIAYVAPKNKTMAHSMSLNNRISFVVGIYIFGFKAYFKQVFNLMEIKKHQHLNISCKQKHSTPRRTSHTINDTMSSDWEPSISRQLSNNKYTTMCLQDEVGCTVVKGYSLKQVSSTWKRQNNSQKTINQRKKQKRCQCGSIKHLRIFSKDCPVVLAIRKAKK